MNIATPVHRLLNQSRTPVLRSSEQSECGLASLGMIAGFHGHHVDMNGLRARFAVSSNGLNLKALVSIAARLGLSTRAVRLELEVLGKLRLPAILHWDMNHFVVLTSADRRGYVIHDPARGRLVMSMTEVSNHFTGIALELQPNDAFVELDREKPFRIHQLWSRSSGITRALTLTAALSVAIQILLFLSPLEVQLVVDQAITQSDGNLLLVICCGFLFLFALQALLEAARTWTMRIAGSAFAFSALGNLLAHVMRLPVTFFHRRHLGDVLSRLGSVGNVQQLLAQGLATTVIDGIMGLAALAILFLYAPALGGIVLGFVSLKLACSLGFAVPIRKAAMSSLQSRATEQTFLMETLRAVTTLRTLGGEAERQSRWNNLYLRAMNDELEGVRQQTLATCAQALLNAAEVTAVVYFAAKKVIYADGFSIGMLTAFLSYRQIVSDRLGQLLGQVISLRLVFLHAERLGDLALAEPERIRAIEQSSSDAFPVILSDVRFRYGSEERDVLDGVDLRLDRHSFVAIRGSSGGGKSTLMSVLLGLYPRTEGSFTIGGRSADPSVFRDWRKHIGVVRQDDQLFSGSLAENISFFDPDMNMARVYEAAHEARVHDEIDAMPMKYQSLVGDMGSALSGGQQQRVLLARALYRKPKIIILDEGTANLDAASEEKIVNFLVHLPICRVAIAHRPSIIKAADEVYRMEAGRLVRER